jgi:pyochelin biosynthetic protein PchC
MSRANVPPGQEGGLAATAGASGGWLRRLPPLSGTDLTFLCFPHAGGIAGYYLPLLRPLANRAEVAVVQYPGRHDRADEQAIPSIRQLARHAVGALRDLRPRRLVLFGHSMGALVAFEAAMLLERGTGTGPDHLFVSGHRPPSRHRPDPARAANESAMVAELHRLGGTDKRVLAHPALVRAMLPALRSDYAAVAGYKYQPGDVVSCGVTALVGDRDPHTTIRDAQAWTAMTTGRFALRAFPGGHFYLDAQRRLLLSALGQRLAALAGGLPCPPEHSWP